MKLCRLLLTLFVVGACHCGFLMNNAYGQQPCEFICNPNDTVVLMTGQCTTEYNDTIQTMGGCGVVVRNSPRIPTTGVTNGRPWGYVHAISFDLQNTSDAPIEITRFGVFTAIVNTDNLTGGKPTQMNVGPQFRRAKYDIYYTSASGSNASANNLNNAANWTLHETVDEVPFNNPGTNLPNMNAITYINLTNPIVLQANETRGIIIDTKAATSLSTFPPPIQIVQVQLRSAGTTADNLLLGKLRILGHGRAGNQPFSLAAPQETAFFGAVQYQSGLFVERVSPDNWNSGDNLGIGVHMFEYRLVDGNNNKDTCKYNVVIQGEDLTFNNCPTDRTEDLEVGDCSYGYNDPVPGFDNDCNLEEGQGYTLEQTEGPLRGSEIPIGDTYFEFVLTSTASGNKDTCAYTITVNAAEPMITDCPEDVTITLDPGQCSSIIEFLEPTIIGCDIKENEDYTFEQIKGVDPRSSIPIGVTEFEYKLTVINTGEESTCAFTATVEEFPNASTTLACNNLVHASVANNNCEAVITADMILEGGPYGCYDSFDIEIATDMQFTNIVGSGNPVIMSGAHVGNRYFVRITSKDGNTCWGEVLIEDKSVPPLECEDVVRVIPCESVVKVSPNSLPIPDSVQYSFRSTSPTGPFYVGGFDPCGDVTLTYTDEEEDLECESEYSSVVHRTWTVVDKSGNTNTCMEDIFRERPHIDSIDIPGTLELTCAEYEAGGGVLGEEGLHCDNIIVSYDDKTVNMCAGSFKIIREYTLVDWCTGETREEIQVIKVTDNVGPEVTCPADVTLSTDFYSCQGEAYPVPTPEIFDACTKATDLDFTVSLSGGGYVSSLPGSNNYVIEGLEVGTHVVTYTVTDNCGNETQCEQRITVEDNVPPTPICDQETKIGIGADGTARLHWTTIEDGSYDNCKIVKNCLLRMDVSEGGKYCNDVKNDCKNYVYFCCEDVGKTIQVLYRVTDGAGNVNTCMVNVTIEDKLKPVVVTPPNVTISCEYDYDVDNLSVYFGKVVRKGEVRDSVLTDDPGRDECLAPVGYTGPTFWGLDGHAGDNCEYTIEELTPLVNLDKCGEGTITRRWSVEDESGSKSVGSQTITVESCDIFTEDDITWPRAELELDACAAGGLDPEALNSKPTYEDGFCGIIAEGYEDEVYTVVEDACFKIKRTWTIIDWCRYNKETGEGSWTFVQYIKVTDMGAISILIEDFTHEDTTAGCTSYVELLPELDSSCSLEEYFDWRYTVDLDNDGTIEREGYARDASGNFPYGTHRVTWKADNGCGNVAEKSILLTVTDGKAPTAVCYHGLSVEVMPSSGEIELGAEYFNRGSFDNCTLSGDLQISYSSDVNDTLTKWTCADLAGLDVMRIEVELWATDAAGNQAYCVTYLELQDNDDVCPNGATGLVSGLIETEEGSGINESEVILQTPNSPTPSVTRTDMVGSYEMLAIMDNSYVLSANKNTNLLNGVTAYDLTLIQRHILGITELTSPYKLIAADINRDGQISGKDLTELRRLILGIDVDFRNNASWQMVDAKASLTPAVVPIDYAQEIAIAHMSTSMQGQDFIGVKIGDVNGTVDATGGLSETRTGVVASLEVEEAAYGVGEEVRVAVRAGETMTMDAYQFTLDFGSSLYYEGVESGVLAVESGNIGSQSLGAGMLSTAWYTDNAVEVSEGEVLFTFVFRAVAGGTLSEALTLSSELTRALAYVNGEERGVELRVGGTSISGEEFALEQNEPNPFSGTTIISYVLPEAGEAVLTIRDVQGRVVYVEEQAGVAGMNQVEVTRDELGAAGVLYYTLESGDYTATKKMVVID